VTLTTPLNIEAWDNRTPIRMVVIDIDHTLITDDHRLTGRTIESVAAARARGVRIVLASSRPALGMTQYLRPLGLTEPDVFIASQGGLIATLAPRGVRVLHSMPIPLRLAKQVAASGQEAGASVNWYAGTDWFVSRLDQRVRREASVVGIDPVETSLGDLTRDPEKILLIASGPDGAEDLRKIPLPGGVEATFSNNGYLEVTAAGVGKGSALQIVANAAGVATGAVAAIGDGENDLAMFRAAGVAIAPANAGAVVKDAADFLTVTNNDDGVAVALDALGA
jgi:Cof subfamily protein (haloacid dehalogenase superfamily)